MDENRGKLPKFGKYRASFIGPVRPQGSADQPPARPPRPRQGLHRRQAHHGAFTDGELDLVISDGGDGRHGMEVPVFDGEGRRYGLTCGYSDYTMCYRLFGAAGEFGLFRANNREVRDVAVGKDKLMKVFTFRSPALRPVEVDLDDGHPDGALGMIVLFYDLDAKEAVKNELLDTDTLTVN
uniref:Uncharacterized protein n=3 Tax=Oryza sativa subsp. japonica TaxID=39947 RepID=Q6Z3Q1_ORYSJ|nr:hypothetical protein [Oryza sativa Japonica Group]